MQSGGETCLTCKADCGYKLANGTLTCCGDRICSAAAGETCATCPGDCGACATCNKNLICEPALGEKCVNGTSGCSDCGNCTANYCGDGRCTWSRYYYTESCVRCPTDCGSCSGLYCGEHSRLPYSCALMIRNLYERIYTYIYRWTACALPLRFLFSFLGLAQR